MEPKQRDAPDERVPREVIEKLSRTSNDIYAELRDLLIMLERQEQDPTNSNWTELIHGSARTLKQKLADFAFALEVLTKLR